MLTNRNTVSIVITLLGAVKLILNGFGVDVLSSTEINDIANGAAAVLTVTGVLLTHLKSQFKPVSQLKPVVAAQPSPSNTASSTVSKQ